MFCLELKDKMHLAGYDFKQYLNLKGLHKTQRLLLGPNQVETPSSNLIPYLILQAISKQ